MWPHIIRDTGRRGVFPWTATDVHNALGDDENPRRPGDRPQPTQPFIGRPQIGPLVVPWEPETTYRIQPRRGRSVTPALRSARATVSVATPK